MSKKRKNSLMELQADIGILVGSGVGLGVGIGFVTQVAAGTPVASTAAGGLSAVAEQQPVLGQVIGIKPIIGLLPELAPKMNKINI